ncbi:hypothetical protein BP5796_07758 [Coleophoma crateriformis]|uniref:RRM domain-containing protein n=1 Tax=Coleophoma crateriformis TaxID=565419 RepID=A0A3D8RCX5_9HELO|nr:hypothetical protein BP5796_07758 [Coleophoma crateriformis]
MASPSPPIEGEYVRLHITPLTPALLHAIVPVSILPSARNISYHTLETFPERAYGFVELPTMEAEKIKKRLNGAILKGTKVRIEPARLVKEVRRDEDKPERVRKVGTKKRKREDQTMPGVDIGDRNVKRGWTTPAAEIKFDKKDKDKMKNINKSKYTTGKECLFKTVLPQNIAAKSEPANKESEEKPYKRKKSKAKKEIVVHEFAKTTKYATFLRGPAGKKKTKAVAEYVEGKGWLDEDGNVVEEIIKKTRKPARIAEFLKAKAEQAEESSSPEESENEEVDEASEDNTAERATPNTSAAVNEAAEAKPDEVAVETSSPENDDSSSSGESVGGFDHSEMDIKSDAAPITREDFPTSSSESSSDEENNSESDSEKEAQEAEVETDEHVIATTSMDVDQVPQIIGKAISPESPSSSEEDSSSDESSDSSDDEEETVDPSATTSRPGSSSGLTIKIPPPVPTSVTVHPLEALYKRKPTTAGTTTTESPAAGPSFSFFGTDAETGSDAEDAPETHTSITIPMTPYTQQDFEHRGLRSAAPTPDTTHASKRFIWPNENEDDEDEEDDSPSRDAPMTKRTEQEESDFQKWFWENRGDTNRAWKKRRKTVAKEKRQRENRRRDGRA